MGKKNKVMEKGEPVKIELLDHKKYRFRTHPKKGWRVKSIGSVWLVEYLEECPPMQRQFRKLFIEGYTEEIVRKHLLRLEIERACIFYPGNGGSTGSFFIPKELSEDHLNRALIFNAPDLPPMFSLVNPGEKFYKLPIV